MDDSINDLFKKASKLPEDIKKQDGQDLQEFQKKAEMAHSNMEKTVKSLREAADKLDQVCRDHQKAHAVGAAGGVVSGLIAIGATVTTWGAASPLLLAAGMGFGLGGAAINLGTNHIETAANSVEVKRALRHLKELSDCVNEVNGLIKHWLNTKEKARLVYICFLASELKFGPFFMKFLHEVMSFCSKTISTLKVSTTGMVVTLANAFGLAKVGQVCTPVTDDVAQAAGTAGQAGGKVGENMARGALIVINVAFLMFDTLDLHYTIRDILQNKGSEAANLLRKTAKELEGI